MFKYCISYDEDTYSYVFHEFQYTQELFLSFIIHCVGKVIGTEVHKFSSGAHEYHRSFKSI